MSGTRVFLLLARLRERRREESRRHRDDSQPEEQDEEGEDASSGGYRKHVTVTNCGEGHDRPPEAVEDRGEVFRLTVVLKVVDPDGREEDQNQGDVKEEDELLAHDADGAAQSADGVTVPSQLQDPKQPQ